MKSKKDDSTLATRADLRLLEQTVQQGFEKIHRDIDRVLDVLINVDKRLTTAVSDHERRITQLETLVANGVT